MTNTADVTCPNCSLTFPIRYFQTACVTLHPQLRQQVLEGSLFRHKCDGCQQFIFVSSDLLYHDVNLRFMVYLVHEDEMRPPEFNTQTLDLCSGLLNQYQFRFVTSYDDLVEKITILENGWNDTIIEKLKLLVVGKIYKFGTDEFVSCAARISRKRLSTPLEQQIPLDIYFQDRLLAESGIPLEMYVKLAQRQEEKSGESNGAGEWKIVNRATILQI